MATVISSSILKGLNQYANENEIDIIAMVNVERNFLDSLFGKSLTKKMALSTRVPLMIIHS